jgi:hypothetical protein
MYKGTNSIVLNMYEPMNQEQADGPFQQPPPSIKQIRSEPVAPQSN